MSKFWFFIIIIRAVPNILFGPNSMPNSVFVFGRIVKSAIRYSPGLSRWVFSLDLKDVSESAAVTMFGREFHVVGAVQRKARPENAVLWNGTDSRIAVFRNAELL